MSNESFRYQARDQKGAATSGVIEAQNRDGALDQLAARGLFPLALEVDARAVSPAPTRVSARSAQTATGDDRAKNRAGPRVSRKEITAFTRELATLLNASIPIPRALDGLGEQNENEKLQLVIRELLAGVRAGESLSTAMRRYPRLFPGFYSSMVEVGEEAGALDKVLSDLADLLENEDEMRGEVTSAIAYPCFVLGLGFVTTFVLLAFVLPRLFGMLESMVDVLPLPTRVLLAVAEFFDAYWIAVVCTLVGGVIALRWYTLTPTGALRWDRLKLSLPVLGSLFRASALCRFARMLGTLERSGVPLLQGLEVVRNTVGNHVVSQTIEVVAEETRGGDSLASPLRKAGLFPPTMIQMIAVGEETGQLDTMLLRVADMQERLLRGRSRAVISLLGPILILAVGAVVGFIVIALLLPIFQMSQALN